MKLELDTNQINIILAGLQELPHKHSDGVIRAIFEQVNAQAEPPAKPNAKTAAKEKE